MDGDEAPLNDLITVAKNSNALLMIDDAHGIGVFGDKGGGLYGLTQQQVPVLMATFGKALGTSGAFIAGSDELIEMLIQKARTYIFTTAMPPAIMAATRQSLRRCQEDTWRREKLVSLVSRFRHGAKQLGLHILPSDSPIQPVILGSNEAVMSASNFLKKRSILVGAIRHPTVKKSSERLRITFSANHTERQVDKLLSSLEASLC